MNRIPLFVTCILISSILLCACEVKTDTPMIKAKRRLAEYLPSEEQQKPAGTVDLSEGPKLRYDAHFGPKDLNFDIKIVDPYQNIMDDTANRKFIGRLVYQVLTGQKCVREAIKLFPETKDRNIICAYHALVHYEADEDIRYHDIEYREAQDEYLEYIAQTLSEGKVLTRDLGGQAKTTEFRDEIIKNLE